MGHCRRDVVVAGERDWKEKEDSIGLRVTSCRQRCLAAWICCLTLLRILPILSQLWAEALTVEFQANNAP